MSLYETLADATHREREFRLAAPAIRAALGGTLAFDT
jgi:hypothetical protein